MYNYRILFSYLSTAVIYASVFGIVFYMPSTIVVAKEKQKETKIALSLSAFVPEVLTPPKIEEVIKAEIPPPIVKKVIKKKIIKKKIKKKIKKTRKKSTKKKVRTKRRVSKKSIAKKSSRLQRKSSKAKKNRFLANIRSKINANKTYPRIAKRRRMQGSVKVKFSILRSGRVGKISLSGKKVFFSSARNAIKSAFPINTRNAVISLPMTINLTLRYSIR